MGLELGAALEGGRSWRRRAFAPEVIACGFDASVYDPSGRMMLTATAFGGLTRRMLAVADELCGGRPAVIQEGGSSPIYVPFCGAMTLAALLGMESPAGDVPGANAKEAQALTPWQRDAVDAALRALDG